MPEWSPETPYRTGVPTILLLLKTVCRLLTAFDEVFKTYAPSEWHPLWDNLASACALFTTTVQPPRS